MHHWVFHKAFNADEWFGFCYLITSPCGRMYIGKKQFRHTTRKKVKGRKNRKHITKQSDWMTYTGSSKELCAAIASQGIENFRFDIISLHETKGSLTYAEVVWQLTFDVLRATLPDGRRAFYNKAITTNIRFIPPKPTDREREHRIS